MRRSIPHPELLPITEAECQPALPERDPSLSLRDYSQEEIDRAIHQRKMFGDMAEYCHNNGISWQAGIGGRRR